MLPDEAPPSEFRGHDDITVEEGEGSLHNDDEDDDDEELATACRNELHQKRLSMESGYSASEKHLEDELVTVEMREQSLPLLLDQSGLPSERLSLPSSQADGKLANRDSGIDSISSPSHSEELCFTSVDDGGGAYPCSPALLPRLSSSSSYAGEGEESEARAGGRRRRDFSEEGDSDLEEEEEAELTLVLLPPKTDHQDSAEVRRRSDKKKIPARVYSWSLSPVSWDGKSPRWLLVPKRRVSQQHLVLPLVLPR